MRSVSAAISLHTHANKHMMNNSSHPALEWDGDQCCRGQVKRSQWGGSFLHRANEATPSSMEPMRPLLPLWSQWGCSFFHGARERLIRNPSLDNEALHDASVLLLWTMYSMSEADLKERPSFYKIRSMILSPRLGRWCKKISTSRPSWPIY